MKVVVEKTRNPGGVITYTATIQDKRGRIIKTAQERENVKAAEQDAIILAYLVTKDAKK